MTEPVRLQPKSDLVQPARPRSAYLDAYLAPLRTWLDSETVTEILVNRPGEVWIEDAEQPGMQSHLVPAIDDQLMQRLAEQVARISHQGINREHPLLSATLPNRPARNPRPLGPGSAPSSPA
jgi:type IV secretion system protein VirB11